MNKTAMKKTRFTPRLTNYCALIRMNSYLRILQRGWPEGQPLFIKNDWLTLRVEKGKSEDPTESPAPRCRHSEYRSHKHA